jgi:hypothetical protein
VARFEVLGLAPGLVVLVDLAHREARTFLMPQAGVAIIVCAG